jgi:hypothetical protein
LGADRIRCAHRQPSNSPEWEQNLIQTLVGAADQCGQGDHSRHQQSDRTHPVRGHLDQLRVVHHQIGPRPLDRYPLDRHPQNQIRHAGWRSGACPEMNDLGPCPCYRRPDSTSP